MPEPHLQDGLRLGKVEEVGGKRLEFGVGRHGQVGRLNLDNVEVNYILWKFLNNDLKIN